MKKKELLASKLLKATPKMMRQAEGDRPVEKTEIYWNDRRSYVTYQYGLYMRCKMLDGLLKVAFFFTEHMRAGGCQPTNCMWIKKLGNFLPMTVWLADG